MIEISSWIPIGVAMVVGVMCLSTATLVCQSLLREPQFDLWLGGILPAIMLVGLVLPPSDQSQIFDIGARVLVALCLMMFLMGMHMSVGRPYLVGIVLATIFGVIVMIFHRDVFSLRLLISAQSTHVDTTIVFIALSMIVLSIWLAPLLDVLASPPSQIELLGLSLGRISSLMIVICAILAAFSAIVGVALPLLGWLGIRLARTLSPGSQRTLLIFACAISVLLVLVVQSIPLVYQAVWS